MFGYNPIQKYIITNIDNILEWLSIDDLAFIKNRASKIKKEKKLLKMSLNKTKLTWDVFIDKNKEQLKQTKGMEDKIIFTNHARYRGWEKLGEDVEYIKNDIKNFRKHGKVILNNKLKIYTNENRYIVEYLPKEDKYIIITCYKK